MLKVENLDTGYGRNQILADLSMEYREDRMATVIGPNGAGKSTLFKAIFGMLEVWEGSVKLGDVDLTDMTPAEHLDKGLALVPQGQNVFGNMSVRENLEMGGYGQDRDELRENIQDIYEMFPLLEDRKGQKAKTMSGGEQQLLEMGRVLMRDPDIVLLDEPSLGLAPDLMDDIFDHVVTIHEEGVGILMIEQNADKALELCDHAFVLDDGHILHEGDASEIRNRDDIQKLYLGG
ncbi:MAG: ABC transporter ATP-binding protein [Halapricum sp.]